jgi:hypothetical protein
MTLSQLEQAEKLLKLAHFLSCSFEEICRRNEVDLDFFRCIQQLHDDKQFYVLLQLRRAENFAQLALDSITPDTGYLRDELEQHLRSLRVLMDKIEAEEHLRRDRKVLLSHDPADSRQELASWITGKATG